MTDSDALLAAIVARPHDDLPRLVYADFLDETGEGERADFARVQVELHRRGVVLPYGAPAPTHSCAACGALWVEWPEDKGWSLCSAECEQCCDNAPMTGPNIRPLGGEVRALLSRERDLLERNWHDWSGRVATYCGNFGHDGAAGVTFARGFVDRVKGRLDWLRKNLPSYPLATKVDVTDIATHRMGDRVFLVPVRENAPRGIGRIFMAGATSPRCLTESFESPGAARAALSAELLAEARMTSSF
jgi:uncharacterized protein (TIGR02996 family)